MKIEGTEQEFKEIFGIGYNQISRGDRRIVDIGEQKLEIIFTDIEEKLRVEKVGPLNSTIVVSDGKTLVAVII